MTPLLCLLGLAGVAAASFASAAMETSIYRASRIRLRFRAERGDAGAAAVVSLLEDIDSLVTAIIVNNNLTAYAAAYFLTAQLSAWRVPYAELLAAVSLTPIFFVLTESLPKRLACSHAEFLAAELARPFRILTRLLFPLSRALNLLAAGMRSLCGIADRTNLFPGRRALFLEHFNAGVAEKVLTPEQHRMAARIMLLESIAIGDCMTRLRGVRRLPASASRRRAVSLLADGKNDAPLLLTGAGGRILGLALTLENLILRPGEPGDPALRAAEPLGRLRAGQSISEALRHFRAKRAECALVEEHGGVVGLITARSVLERIAGERPEGETRIRGNAAESSRTGSATRAGN